MATRDVGTEKFVDSLRARGSAATVRNAKLTASRFVERW